MNKYLEYLHKYTSNKQVINLLELLNENNDNYVITDMSFNEENQSLRFYVLINSKSKQESFDLFSKAIMILDGKNSTDLTISIIKDLTFSPKNNQQHFIRVSHFALEIKSDNIIFKPYCTVDENYPDGDVNYFIGDFLIKLRCIRELIKPLNSKFMKTFLNGNLWKKYHIQFGYNIDKNTVISQKIYFEIPEQNFSLEEVEEIHQEIISSYRNTEHEQIAISFVSDMSKILPIIKKSNYKIHLFSLESNSERDNAFRYYITPLGNNEKYLFNLLFQEELITEDQFRNLMTDISEKKLGGFKIYDVGITFHDKKLRITITYDI